MAQLEQARKNRITAQMRRVARDERQTPEFIREQIAKGKIVIPYNKNHHPKKVYGIGQGLSTKVNANIGTSSDLSKTKEELKKLTVSVSAGAHTVMDLSTGGDIAKLRKIILQNCPVPLGTVPIYEAAINAVKKSGSIAKMSEKDILEAIEKHAKDGVDFFTLHCGVTGESIARLKAEKRITGVVSRGGAILVEWMSKNKKENPLYEYYDEVLDIAKRYDVTISLGDGMRPGCLADATDRTQIQELVLLGELAQRAKDKGVQVIIEGPGHVPIDQIQANVVLEKRLCHGAPFYVLGPLVTDIAPGYDHITAAIGGALAASYGADFLCYVTASEHLRLPTIEDVREGVIVSRIAAHAADIAKGVNKAMDWDVKISKARKKRDWKKQITLSIDPQRFKQIRRGLKSTAKDVCTMCSQYCSLKISEGISYGAFVKKKAT
ncbi:MAG: phosphomethylpyrimidine synthase ThiC [Candidatus Omnitrophica bacterium]|nr:phosphomethylpyrimidine synthase ThiC [Candidatus Omnitrophota bacterium]